MVGPNMVRVLWAAELLGFSMDFTNLSQQYRN